MLSDYHIHTHFSTDSEALPSEHIERAIKLGIKEICFTDHVDYDYPKENGKTVFVIDSDQYFKELLPLKEKYADKIKIKIGVELGLIPSNYEKAQALLKTYPFDFVIGSSHLIDGGDPYYPEFWNGISANDAIEKYYEAILRNVTAYEDYDVYGHLDYIRRYVPDKSFVYRNEAFYDITDMILKNIIAKGKGIELNTKGLSSGITNFIPTILILKRYRELGGEIVTVGSDCHTTDKLGYAFKTARDILINTGFKYITSFEKRNPSFICIK